MKLNLKGLSILVLIVVALCTIFFGFFVTKLEFNYDFERFFPEGDPDLEYYLEHRAKFETDNDFLLIAIEQKGGVFNVPFLARIDSVTRKIERLKEVDYVQSPTTIFRVVNGPFGPIKVPFLHKNDAEKLPIDSVNIFKEKGLIGTFFSENASAVCLLVKHAPDLSKVKSDALIKAVEQVVNASNFDQVHYAGKVHGQYYYIQKIEQELLFFMGTSFLLVLLFLIWSFKNFWAVTIPLVVVVFSLVWSFAMMAFSGQKIDVVATLMPTILFVVGMSDSVHFFTRYFDLVHRGEGILTGLKRTFSEVGVATFLTSLTTGVGFATLITAQIIPIKVFGLYTAIGVFIAFILTYLLVPTALYLLGYKAIPKQKQESQIWNQFLNRLFLLIIRNQKKIMGFSIAIAVISLIGISKISVDNFLLEDLSDRDPIKKSYLFIEHHFSGARPFEMALESNETLLDYEKMRKIHLLEQYLEQEYGVGALVSPLMIIKQINRANQGGDVAFNTFPTSESEFNRCVEILRSQAKRLQLSKILSGDEKTYRITGKIPDFGGKQTKIMDEQLSQYIHTVMPEEVDFKITGMAKLIDKNNEYLASNMLLGLLISVLLISFIMAYLYKSWGIVLVALIPNVLPLLMIGGLIGFSGLYLNASTSIIFTIAFGIAVDDTIHFLTKLKAELKNHNRIVYALRNTFLTTGKAIIITSLILSGGFLSLVCSSFTSIYNVGLLISLTLLFALLADLLLLPVLVLKWKFSKKERLKVNS